MSSPPESINPSTCKLFMRDITTIPSNQTIHDIPHILEPDSPYAKDFKTLPVDFNVVKASKQAEKYHGLFCGESQGGI